MTSTPESDRPRTPELGSPLNGEPLESSPNVITSSAVTPPTSSAADMPLAPSLASSPLAQHTMTPGRPTRSSFSGTPLRPWATVRSESRRPQFNIGQERVPPMPLPTFFTTAAEVPTIPEAELRPSLLKAIEAKDAFERAAGRFRSLANQYFLQNKLLSIETHESAQRHEVETSITKREIERLIVEVMGYSDASSGTDQIRRKLRRTKQRLKDLEDLMAIKDKEIYDLQRRNQDLSSHAGVGPGTSTSHNNGTISSQTHMHQHTPDKRQRPPSLSLATNLEHMRTHPEQREPLSALEMLASQVLTDQIQHRNDQEESPSKRRRDSSNSTISASSTGENDTLEEAVSA